MKLIDTHCHIHDKQYEWSDDVVKNAKKADVWQIITAGTDVADSRAALGFAAKYDNVFATVGVYPNVKTRENITELEKIIVQSSGTAKLVGLGDIGLDYHYKPFDRDYQIKLFENQLNLAVKYNLPISFHVREAYDDFWPIYDNFKHLRGTLHCYTDNVANLEKALSRGLYISVNGILTFNKSPELEKVFDMIPIKNLLLETDAPYLTPSSFRAKLNEPAYVVEVARSLADRCGCEITEIADMTMSNATMLFSLH